MSANTPAEPSATARAVIAAARGWIGTPYCHAASLRGVGCDCLGLVRGVWRELYGAEPEEPGPYSPDWAEATGEERLADAARRHLRPVPVPQIGPGDLLLFRWRDGLPAKHLAIASGPDSIIHAHDGACVAEVAIAPWRRRLAWGFRFPDLPSHAEIAP